MTKLFCDVCSSDKNVKAIESIHCGNEQDRVIFKKDLCDFCLKTLAETINKAILKNRP